MSFVVLTALLQSAVLAAEPAPRIDPEGDPTLRDVSADGAPTITPHLLVQTWATLYDMDTADQADPAGYGDPEDDIGFKVRRARLGFTGAWGRYDYAMVFGVSSGADPLLSADQNPRVDIIDAWAGYTFGDPGKVTARVSAGSQRVPYGRENLLSTGALVFQERTVASNHLGPFRDAGVLADVRSGGARLRVGAFNGNDSYLGDDDPGLLLAARAEYSQGEDVYSTWGEVESLTLGVAGDFMFNPQFATTTMTYGGDVILRVKGLALLIEGHAAQITPNSDGVTDPSVFATTNQWGGYAQLGYTIGAWEPAARVEIFDDSTAATDNGDLIHVTAGATAHLLDDHLRLGGGYVLRMERGGQSLPNDTVRLWGQVKF